MNRLIQEAQNREAIGERFNRLTKHPSLDVLRYEARDGTRFFIDTRPLDQGRDPIITSQTACEFGTSAQMHTRAKGQIELVGRVRFARLNDLLVLCDYWAAKATYFRQTGTFPPDSPIDQFRDSTARFWEGLRNRFRGFSPERGLPVNKHQRAATAR